jgi:hypothetical protein
VNAVVRREEVHLGGLAMFRILAEPLLVEGWLGCWAKHMGRFSQFVGTTSFGDVFLHDPASGQYGLLCPLSGDRFPIDCHDRETFLNGFLADPTIVEQLARPSDVAELQERLGLLADDEVYIPCPYPFVGGSGELSTYQKGRVWEFLELVGLFRGLGEPGQLEVKVEGTTATIEIHVPGAGQAPIPE